MTSRGQARLLTALALGLVLGSPWAARADRADVEIVIEADRVRPETTRTTTRGRVIFANRSGRAVHVEFLDDAGRHHVAQVPGSIWATFHQPGQHPYVVHFYGGRPLELRGTVEVTVDPEVGGYAPTCGWLTVEEVCVAP